MFAMSRKLLSLVNLRGDNSSLNDFVFVPLISSFPDLITCLMSRIMSRKNSYSFDLKDIAAFSYALNISLKWVKCYSLLLEKIILQSLYNKNGAHMNPDREISSAR